MADADLQGSDGHGVIRLPQYIKRIRAGGINKQPNIRIVHERAAMAVVDGDNGMGHLVVSRAVDIAIEKARTAGVAWVSTRYSNHAGPASLYARRPLEHDMLGLYFAVGNANHLPPWGGMDMLLSTNPIAAGIPTGDEPPVVLDMATTVAAYGKVKAKAKRGEQMPAGWMIDRQGQPLLDPKRAGEGFLLPIGEHKGYGLALIVGLLAGTLGGAAMGRDVIDFNADHVSVTNTGQAILVIDLRGLRRPGAVQARGGHAGARHPRQRTPAGRRPHLAARRAEPPEARALPRARHPDLAGRDGRPGRAGGRARHRAPGSIARCLKHRRPPHRRAASSSTARTAARSCRAACTPTGACRSG